MWDVEFSVTSRGIILYARTEHRARGRRVPQQGEEDCARSPHWGDGITMARCSGLKSGQHDVAGGDAHEKRQTF